MACKTKSREPPGFQGCGLPELRGAFVVSLTCVSFALETSHGTSFTDVGIAAKTARSPNAAVVSPW